MSVPKFDLGAARGSLRVRLVALATMAVAIVLFAGGLALVLTQRAQLIANLDASLDQRADAFATNLGAETPDSTTPLIIPTSNGEDRAMQLVSVDGTILAASPSLSGEALPNRPDGDRLEVIETVSLPEIEDDGFRLLSRRIDLPDGPAILHVAQNIDDLDDTIRGLAISLAIAIPVTVVTMASLAWWLVDRTLKPVEVAQRKQQRFIADASHELRTPITRLRTEVEVDLAQPGNADPERTNRAVLEEAKGLQLLLDDLLFLARSDEDSIARRHKPVDLDDVVLAEVATARLESSHTIDTTGVSAALVRGDQQQLRRLVRNLLTNALRHAADSVVIELSEVGGEIVLAISDDGAGVPAAEHERIFERFGRVDDARSREHGGSGLGLAIARDIVTRHGGTIRYDEKAPPSSVVAAQLQPAGARFVVRLPGADDSIRSTQ